MAMDLFRIDGNSRCIFRNESNSRSVKWVS